MSEWFVICQPIERDTSSTTLNLAGLVVKLCDGDFTWEIGRVAFNRTNSTRPEMSFEDALSDLLNKAEDARGIIEEFQEEEQRVLQEAEQRSRDRVSAILGVQPGKASELL